MVKNPILKVDHLSKYFYATALRAKHKDSCVRAVDDVSFSVLPGETFGIVGESGCGKSTLGRTVLRLIEPTSGSAEFEGQDIFSANASQLRQLRQKMQIVFQDPYASLDPHMTIRNAIREPLDIANELSREERNERVLALLEQVGLHGEYMDRFPYEFSGGQRQRICIARALALEPKLLVCDEPVSALDVSVQSQILNLFQRLQNRLGLTYLFISHDLSVVQHISDHICVMYLGQIMELGTTAEVYGAPQHPYTQCLLSAVLKPIPHSHTSAQAVYRAAAAPGAAGCPFYHRCPNAMSRCMEDSPCMAEVASDHYVRCHLFAGR